MTPHQRLAVLGIVLPKIDPPAGLYRPVVRTGNLVFLSGCGPTRPDGTSVRGKVGSDIDLPTARHATRLTGLQLLSRLWADIGSLDQVVQVVKVLGMVNCAPGFNQTPSVIDGCSELFIEVFGDAGRGARSAVGMAELPADICVEIEAIIEIRPT